MATLIVPPLDAKLWPTLGPLICDFLEDRAVYGPGSLRGEPYVIDDEFRAWLYRAYEIFPKGHTLAGRRRFKRAGISVRKGTAKTEKAAMVGFAELHPEAPVRCDGFDARGEPVGRPVRDPFIPMVAYTEEQTEDLAYAALYVIVSEGEDADLFDIGLDRILRLDENGRPGGKAAPYAAAPNARDGARTTWQHFDEPHRMTLPSLRKAHETMLANLPKRPLEDPWTCYTTTAGEPGDDSVAEGVHKEAEQIARGQLSDPDLFYFHREAGPGHDLATVDGRIAAIAEATGPVGEFGPGQFRDIARQWDRPGADKAYLERVWLNRWVRSEQQAFDPKRWAVLADKPKKAKRSDPEPVAPFHTLELGRHVVAGFDGARFRDATGIVVTDIETARQYLWGLWERPVDLDEDADWEVPEDEVTASVEDLMFRLKVHRFYGDPPHWTETIASWSARWPDIVEEWWTNRHRAMAQAVRNYQEAMASGAVHNDGHPEFARHIAAAGQRKTRLVDEDGQPMYLLTKQREDRKFDAAMAGCLSWRAYLDEVADPKKLPADTFVPYRIR